MVAKLFTTPFALNGNKLPIPVGTQPDGSVAYEVGFGPDYERQLGVDPQAKNIARTSFNQLMYDATLALREVQSGYGTSVYSLALAQSLPGGGYPVGAVIPSLLGDCLWLCRTANNTSNPDAGGAGWLRFVPQGGDYSVATGSANVQTATYTPSLSSAEGTIARFKAVATNTGPMTFNGLAVLGTGGDALAGGEVIAGSVISVIRVGGNWFLTSNPGGPLSIAVATQGNQAMRLSQAVGRLIDIRTFTANGTYTPTPGTRAIRIRLIGGGAGGGGSTATTAGQISFGTGGSSGSYAEGFFTSFPASMAVVVGAAGSGLTGTNGTAGGSSSVGSLISVNGGSPGGVFGPVGPPIAGLVVPSGISITGAYLAVPSEAASIAFVTSTITGFSGGGGNGKLGAGGTPLNAAGTGQVGRGYGAGGGGAISFASQPLASGGGNGSPGFVQIEEYT